VQRVRYIRIQFLDLHQQLVENIDVGVVALLKICEDEFLGGACEVLLGEELEEADSADGEDHLALELLEGRGVLVQKRFERRELLLDGRKHLLDLGEDVALVERVAHEVLLVRVLEAADEQLEGLDGGVQHFVLVPLLGFVQVVRHLVEERDLRLHLFLLLLEVGLQLAVEEEQRLAGAGEGGLDELQVLLVHVGDRALGVLRDGVSLQHEALEAESVRLLEGRVNILHSGRQFEHELALGRPHVVQADVLQLLEQLLEFFALAVDLAEQFRVRLAQELA